MHRPDCRNQIARRAFPQWTALQLDGGTVSGSYVGPSPAGLGAEPAGCYLMLLRRMGRGDLTAHGFRSTFRDWASERTNFPREVCEAALAHAVENRTEAAYRRGDLFAKRRQLMDAWARYSAAPVVDPKLVTLAAV